MTTALADEIKPGVLRTPESRFENLPGFNFEPNYTDIDGYRMHFLDEGDSNAAPVLMLHGEPSWSFLYRKMIGPVAGAGHRVIAPDLIGFGKSDKPVEISTHSYAFHVEAMTQFIEDQNLTNITLVCQDWGSLIGLRVAAENPDRFARIVLANGALPTAGEPLGEGFSNWRVQASRMQEAGDMPVGMIVGRGHGAEVIGAYDAPFPEPKYKAGPLAMPLLVPVSEEDPANAANEAAWRVFEKWEKPFLTAFSDGDPVTKGREKKFKTRVPGASNQKHVILSGGGHFLQEDIGEKLADVIIEFIEDNPLP
ncbi:MAG: haloalkane dehalogenase [Pseudohongiellaceae bacterium]